MKRTSNYKNGFPYDDKSVCYLYFDVAHEIKQVSRDIDPMKAYKYALHHKARIVAVYKSESYIVDDLTKFAIAVGIVSTKFPVIIKGFHIYEKYSTKLSDFVGVEYETLDNLPDGTNFKQEMLKLLKKFYGWNFRTSKILPSGTPSGEFNCYVKGNASTCL